MPSHLTDSIPNRLDKYSVSSLPRTASPSFQRGVSTCGSRYQVVVQCLPPPASSCASPMMK